MTATDFRSSLVTVSLAFNAKVLSRQDFNRQVLPNTCSPVPAEDISQKKVMEMDVGATFGGIACVCLPAHREAVCGDGGAQLVLLPLLQAPPCASRRRPPVPAAPARSHSISSKLHLPNCLVYTPNHKKLIYLYYQSTYTQLRKCAPWPKPKLPPPPLTKHPSHPFARASSAATRSRSI